METIGTGFVTSVIAVQVAAAAFGLLVSLGLAGDRIAKLAGSGRVSAKPTGNRQLQNLHVVALCLVLATSTALFALWMERICVPGDAPMIFRMDLRLLPDAAMVKMVLVIGLAVCAVWLAGTRGPSLRRTSSVPASTDDGLRLARRLTFSVAGITAPAACWLSLAAVSLTQPLSQWPAAAMLAGIGLLWLATALLIASAIMAWRQGGGASLAPVTDG